MRYILFWWRIRKNVQLSVCLRDAYQFYVDRFCWSQNIRNPVDTLNHFGSYSLSQVCVCWENFENLSWLTKFLSSYTNLWSRVSKVCVLGLIQPNVYNSSRYMLFVWISWINWWPAITYWNFADTQELSQIIVNDVKQL